MSGEVLLDVCSSFQTPSFDGVDGRGSQGNDFTELEHVSSFKQEFLYDPIRAFETESSVTCWSDKSVQDSINVDIFDWMFTVDSCRRPECQDSRAEHLRVDEDEVRILQKATKPEPSPYSMTDLLRDYHMDDFTDVNELDLQMKDGLSVDYEFLCDDAPMLPNISSFIGPCDDLFSPLHYTPPSTPPKLNSSPVNTGLSSTNASDGKSLIHNKSGRSHHNTTDKKHFVKRPKKTKATHLWKFMRSLLDDPAYNPSFIKWENKEKGVFRIVPGQSKNIAKLWGQKKNNPTMTFDKLSRSLRWCREYGFLSKVPSNEGFPKKLCFRFGDRAMDWNGN